MEETQQQQPTEKKKRGRPRIYTEKEAIERNKIRAREYYRKNINKCRARNNMYKNQMYHLGKLMT